MKMNNLSKDLEVFPLTLIKCDAKFFFPPKFYKIHCPSNGL
jgi:hypothetical protein